MRKKKARKSPSKQARALTKVIELAGSGRAVADQIRTTGVKCSQQSVSAWAGGDWVPRLRIQQKLQELYGIPMPWSGT